MYMQASLCPLFQGGEHSVVSAATQLLTAPQMFRPCPSNGCAPPTDTSHTPITSPIKTHASRFYNAHEDIKLLKAGLCKCRYYMDNSCYPPTTLVVHKDLHMSRCLQPNAKVCVAGNSNSRYSETCLYRPLNVTTFAMYRHDCSVPSNCLYNSIVLTSL